MPYSIITLALNFWHSQVEQAQINEADIFCQTIWDKIIGIHWK